MAAAAVTAGAQSKCLEMGDMPVERARTASVRTNDSLKHEGEASDSGPGWKSSALMYVAFVFVGASCGWFVLDGVYQLMANEPQVQRGGAMYGTVSIMMGAGGISAALAYLIFIALRPQGLSLGQGQAAVTIIGLLTISTLSTLAAFWSVGGPGFPVVVAASLFSSIVANATYFFAFPVVVTYYGGWLVAPVRAGTDMSSLITTLLAEAQNPSGMRNLFPSWLLFAIYCFISLLGLSAWICIVWFRLGLGSGEVADVAKVSSREEASTRSRDLEAWTGDTAPGPRIGTAAPGRERSALDALKHHLRGLRCPRFLWGPVAFALVVEMMQWCVLAPVAESLASMTDPSGCDGAHAKFVYRTALTLNRVALPFASLASSVAWCPRWLFNCLGTAQASACIVMLSIATNLAREFWTTSAGQTLFCVLYTVVGGCEGYVLTMAYRYIGDSPGMSPELKQSASSLLSFFTVLLVNPFAIAMGCVINAGVFTCTNP